jgi:hypothetical protein
MRYAVIIIGLTFFFFTKNFPQEKKTTSFHPFSNAIAFTGEIGGSLAYTDFTIPELDFFGRGSVEYYFPSQTIHAFGIKFIGGGGLISAEHEGTERIYPPPSSNFRTSILFLGGGLVYAVKLGNGVPYVSATFAYLRFDPRDKDGNFLPNNRKRIYDPNGFTFGGELGVRFPFADMFSLNIGAKVNYTNSDYLDDIEKGLHNDAFVNGFIGFSLYIGAERDDDNDGVENSKDICPNTPLGIAVNEFGCATDSDHDGIPDYLDKCSNTEKNIVVDENGCPTDSDNDGVPDYIDKCPNTPKDAIVDANGCSRGQDAVGAIKSEHDSTQLIQGGYNLLNEKHLSDMFFTDGNLFCFQISSFRDRNLAEEEAYYFRSKGHKVYIIEAIPFNDGKIWHRVRIGYFKSLLDAIKYRNKYFN